MHFSSQNLIDLDVPGIEGETSTPSEDALQAMRRGFAINRFVGWHAWLQTFQKALVGRDAATCRALLKEVTEGGYELSLIEQDRLADWADLAYHNEGGLLALWQEHQRRLQACEQFPGSAQEAQVRYRLGLAYQQFPQYEAARTHYSRSLTLFQAAEKTREASQVRMALLALEQQERTRTENPYFENITRLIKVGKIDVQDECRRLAKDMLQGDDWRLGRQAIVALDRWDDLKTTAGGLASSSVAVQAAAVAVLRKKGVARCEAELIGALKHENDFVRWQAAIALGGGSRATVQPLLDSLQHEADEAVRLAVAHSLVQTGDPSVIARLRGFPDLANTIDSTSYDAASAYRRIHVRFPPPPRQESDSGTPPPPPPHFDFRTPPPPRSAPPEATYKDLLSDLDQWIRSAPFLWYIATVISLVIVGPMCLIIFGVLFFDFNWRAPAPMLYELSFWIIFTAAARNGGFFGELLFAILLTLMLRKLVSPSVLRSLAQMFRGSSAGQGIP